MVGEVFKEIFAFFGLMTVLVAVLGIILNEIVWGNWYGETEEQKRERIRKERAERRRRVG